MTNRLEYIRFEKMKKPSVGTKKDVKEIKYSLDWLPDEKKSNKKKWKPWRYEKQVPDPLSYWEEIRREK